MTHKETSDSLKFSILEDYPSAVVPTVSLSRTQGSVLSVPAICYGVVHMAIVKATYTKKSAEAKASIRYIAHRPGNEGSKITRQLFTSDGVIERTQAYRMIDSAAKGSIFFRFVISPDPNREDTEKDLHLREVTDKTMQALEERLHKPVIWVAAEHNDHAPHRHVHIVAIVPGRLNVQDFGVLRKTATDACLQQRQERDQMREVVREQTEEAQWER